MPWHETRIRTLYKVRLSNTDAGILSRTELFHPDGPLGPDSLHPPTGDSDPDDEVDPLIPVLPTWMKIGTKLTLLIKDRHYKGFLDLDTDNDWLITVRGRRGQLVLEHPLVALDYSWHDRIIDGSMQLGHQELQPDHLTARHVSAKGLLQSCPGSLRKALDSSNPDQNTWLASYTEEEYNGLVALDTFTTINRADLAVSDFVRKPMPTMCVLTIKTDEFHNQVRAKSRIVVLGNLESRMWTTSECYAPVLRQDSLRLLTSIAVQNQCILKQGNCKNDFCQPHLPIDEVVIVAPPAGCPISKPGTLWRLNKTLYGLRRSPRHKTVFLAVIFAPNRAENTAENCVTFAVFLWVVHVPAAREIK